MAEAPVILDLRGLRCPLPVLRLEAQARRLTPGTILEVLTDDPIARVDIPHAMVKAGHSCVELKTTESRASQCVFKVTLSGLD